MDNKIKITLGLIAAGSLFYAAFRKRNNKVKQFTAPDGNMYLENQLYRTYDDKLYKNGKQVRFNTKDMEEKPSTVTNHYDDNQTIPKNFQLFNKNVSYHQRGIRHH